MGVSLFGGQVYGFCRPFLGWATMDHNWIKNQTEGTARPRSRPSRLAGRLAGRTAGHWVAPAPAPALAVLKASPGGPPRGGVPRAGDGRPRRHGKRDPCMNEALGAVCHVPCAQRRHGGQAFDDPQRKPGGSSRAARPARARRTHRALRLAGSPLVGTGRAAWHRGGRVRGASRARNPPQDRCARDREPSQAAAGSKPARGRARVTDKACGRQEQTHRPTDRRRGNP